MDSFMPWAMKKSNTYETILGVLYNWQLVLLNFSGYQRLPQKEIICLKAPSTISTYTTTQTNTENYDQPKDEVCNTVYPSAPHMTNVPDSVQKL